MPAFPLLSSSAVTQYPATAGLMHPAQIVRFIDGASQRFVSRGMTLNRWLIRLHLLSDLELANIEVFFASMAGEYSVFDFTDPVSGLVIPNCRFSSPTLVTDYIANDAGSTSIWVVQTNA